ncbi:zinc fingers and homeoboxes protein 1 isoform X2 [Pristis pectinata]|uniref:zinc fingers and homeoboxes protein 1 isoform X2 n=1 Tax=Pristis pectinata TaxID=685728 RepID=UPI00223D462B|nr:zinc fingers and homeoboxes protein 1 isoform X2 [Pristis pectinata]
MAGMVKAGDRKECRCWHQEQQTNCWRNSVGRAVSVEGNGLSMFQWFWDDISTADDVEKLTALKFRGDLAFKRQDYQKALCEYTSSLALVPDTNIALRRDLQEARARCLSYLGREEDALHIAQKLRTEVTNTDHLTTVLNLNIQIYRNAGNLTQEICCLQQLISLHPLNPWYWKKLAEAYLGLVQALSSPTVPSVPDCKDGHCLRTSLQPARQAESSKTGPDCAQLQNVNKRSSMSVVCERQSICPAHVSTEENSVLMLTGSRKAPGNVSSSYSTFGINLETESKIGGELRDQWLFACSSFVRARLLLQMMKPQQASFVLERSQAVQEEISQQLSSLNLSEEVLNALTKTMGKDLFPERIKNGAEAERCAAPPNSSALVNLAIGSGSDFEERWFKKPNCKSIPQAQ